MRQVRVLYTSGSVADATCRVPTNAGAAGSGPSGLRLRQGLFGALLRRSSAALQAQSNEVFHRELTGQTKTPSWVENGAA